MKKVFFFLTVIVALLLTSCKESNDSVNEYANWQSRNDAYFENIYKTAKGYIDAGNNSEWKIIPSVSKVSAKKITDNIVVKVIENGTGSGCPLESDSVRVYYRGRFMPTDNYPEGKIFDGNWYDKLDYNRSIPTAMAVANTRDGFSTALQNMHIGDRWLVYIPYDLGYGTSDYSSIPGGSTLIFDVTLHSYARKGTSLPVFK